MDCCPLVQLAKHRQLLKKFDQTGRVAIPVSQWIRFFEALVFIHREGGQREIYSVIVDGYLVFSKTPFKRKVEIKPEQIELFDG